MIESVPCPIWETNAEEFPADSRYGAHMDSPRAGGRCFIPGTTGVLRRYTTEHGRARLTSWLVEQRRLGAECPEVKTKAVEDAKRRPPLSVHERADRLLKCISLELDDVADMLGH